MYGRLVFGAVSVRALEVRDRAQFAGGGKAGPRPRCFCRGRDLPLQQSRRVAGLADDRRRLGAAARGRRRTYTLAGAVRRARRPRLPDQTVAGRTGDARARRYLSGGRPPETCQPALPTGGGLGRGGGGRRLVGRDSAVVAGGRPAVDRWLPAQLDPRVDVRIQRLWPAVR